MPRDVFSEGVDVGRKPVARKKKPAVAAPAGTGASVSEVVNPTTGVRLDLNVTRPDLYKPPSGYEVRQRPRAEPSVGSAVLEAAPMRDPYGGMVPFRPGKPVAPAPAPTAYGGMLPFRPGKVQADLAYEAEAAKRRGGRSAYGGAVRAQQPQTDDDLAASFARAGAPLEGSHYLADTAGMRAPGTLVTPKGLTRAAVADVISGRTPNLTAQNMQANPPPIAPGPYAPGRVKIGGGLRLGAVQDQPSVAGAVGGPSAGGGVAAPAAAASGTPPRYTSDQRRELIDSGTLAAADVARRSGGRVLDRTGQIGSGTATLPDGTTEAVPTLQGNWSTAASGQGPKGSLDAIKFARENPHLVNQFSPAMRAKIDAALPGGIAGLQPTASSQRRAAYLSDRKADMDSRRAAVGVKAQRRAEARRARMESRNAGPSVADVLLRQVAQQDPAAAAQLLGLHNTRAAQLAGQAEDRKLRRELGLGEIDVRREESKATQARYGSDDAAKFGELAQQAEANAIQAQANGDLASARRFRDEAAQWRQRSAAGGASGAAPAATGSDSTGSRRPSVAELPPDVQERLGAATPIEADRMLKNLGVDDASRRQYLQQRENEQRGGLGQTLYDNSGGLFRGIIDALVGLNPPPEVVGLPDRNPGPSVEGAVAPLAKPKKRTPPRTPNSRIPALLGTP